MKPGEVFYEAPNALHAVSCNASKTEPLKYLVIQVSDPRVTLTSAQWENLKFLVDGPKSN